MTRQNVDITPPRTLYSGTTKTTICDFCKKNLDHLTRVQQDAHEKQHEAQKTL